MTNVEKYLDKLKDFKGDFAINSDGGIIKCTSALCSECKFNCTSKVCFASKLDWLFQKCQSELSEMEEILIDYAGILRNVKYKYIARDRNGSLFLYTEQPKKSNNLLCSGEFLNISKKLFPWIQYSDGIYDIEAKSFIEE